MLYSILNKLRFNSNFECVDAVNGLLEEGMDEANKLMEENRKLKKEIVKIKEDAKNAVNTTWRFIGVYKKEINLPINQALKSAEYHLKNIDYIFEDQI